MYAVDKRPGAPGIRRSRRHGPGASGRLVENGVQDGVHPVQAVAFLAQLAARASPLQALLTEIVPEEQRGSLMSLSMAAGQLGFGAGGAIAGPAYGMYGYVSNTVIGAASVVLTALLVWRLLPEPQLKTA